MKVDRARVQLQPTTIPLLLGALFLSGLAAIINQTVWQRALRIYLAGCESVSSMIIVLVFMLGLGAGSLVAGRWAHRIANPLRALALVELGLCAVNLSITLLLALDISESVYAFQRMAVSLGIPLRVVYGVSATAMLVVPCFLMGITMPLVSEVAQRQMHYESSGFVTVLFLLNTLGSVAGGIVSGFLLMPYLGQATSLLIGAICNGAAALVLLGLYVTRYGQPAEPGVAEAPRMKAGRLAPEEVLGFWMGFLALGYEMYLFRIGALAHMPLPYNFSIILCYFLAFWSLGLYLGKKMKESILPLLVLTAALVALAPGFYWFDRQFLHAFLEEKLGIGLPLSISAAIYCLPCIAFGCLFAQVLARHAKSWGRDVGRFYGLNTLGSCLGILVMTLLGYEINHAYTALLIAVGYFAMYCYAKRTIQLAAESRAGRWSVGLGLATLTLGLAVLVPFFAILDLRPAWLVSRVMPDARVAYYGKDGVVEVTSTGGMYWDGLWHSSLSIDGSHIGSFNWLMAAVPPLCHDDGPIEDALVVGLGTGITAATLALSNDVKSIDVYEIDRKLLTILEDYRDGTLGVIDNPKVNLIWQDARAGLALSEKQYDLIIQHPLYLVQAGSSMLLSQEYMEMVRKRLKTNGVFCIYSKSIGNEEQALLVRKTASTVFPYCESFGEGYMIVASNSPFVFHTERLDNSDNDPLLSEIRAWSVQEMKDFFDSPRLEWDDCPYVITDDHPIIEYPAAVRRLLAD